MRAFYSDHFVLPLPEGHKFPMAKYSRLRERILVEGIISPNDLYEAPLATIDDLHLAHAPEYVDAVLTGTVPHEIQRRIGFPWSPQMVERSRRSVGATIAAAHAALDDGVAANLAGGTHHAFADRGEGFCVFNDVAVAVRSLQHSGTVHNVAIVDLDVHQGNGTARLFENDPDVFTFSMHGDNNYPFHKESSRLDVGLPDGCDDSFYLGELARHLDAVLDAAQPDLVCYLGGADPYSGDRFGRLKLSMDGLRRRDRMLFETCYRRSLPVVLTLAGGYAADLQDIATIHLNTLRELLAYYG